MKSIWRESKRGFSLLLAAVIICGSVFINDSLQTNATDGTSNDYNSDSKVDVCDLVELVDNDQSNSTEATELRKELLGIVETSVENDDGTFEGNTGIVSIYNSRILEGSFAYNGAAFVDFQSVKTNEGNKLYVKSTSNDGSAYDMIYIKFDQKVQNGVTYQISMDLEALNDNYTDGVWKYAIVDPTMGMYTMVAPTVVEGNDLFKTGRTFDFTAKKDCDYFYLVLFEYNSGAAGVWMDFTIDNINLTGIAPITTSVEGDDGTFEGNSGKISLYNTRLLEGSHAYGGAAFIDFQRMITSEGTKLHVTSRSSTGTNYDMVYIKFNQKVEKGATYRVSMDLEALDDTFVNGTWKYSFTDTTKTLGTLKANKEITDKSTIFTKGRTFEFTAQKDCEHFYLVFWEWTGQGGVWMNFTIDNIKLDITYPVTTSAVGDDGSFEGNTGIVSLYSPATSGTTNSYATYCADEVLFQKVMKDGTNTVLTIKSTDYSGIEAKRKGAVYIKFAQTFAAGKTYTISYDAKWNGTDFETAGNVFGYSLLPSVNNWLNTDDNIQKYKFTTTAYNGAFSVDFIPTETLEECYLLLHITTIDVNFDMEIDNITVAEKVTNE